MLPQEWGIKCKKRRRTKRIPGVSRDVVGLVVLVGNEGKERWRLLHRLAYTQWKNADYQIRDSGFTGQGLEKTRGKKYIIGDHAM